MTSPYPPDRAQAAVRLAESGDQQAVHALVTLLEDDDPAVRLYCILALARLCGTTNGYRYYDPPEQRAAAAARWRMALRAGSVALRSGADAGATGELGSPAGGGAAP